MVISWNLGPGNGQADGIRQADLMLSLHDHSTLQMLKL
jgi:hypothetical protein